MYWCVGIICEITFQSESSLEKVMSIYQKIQKDRKTKQYYEIFKCKKRESKLQEVPSKSWLIPLQRKQIHFPTAVFFFLVFLECRWERERKSPKLCWELPRNNFNELTNKHKMSNKERKGTHFKPLCIPKILVHIFHLKTFSSTSLKISPPILNTKERKKVLHPSSEKDFAEAQNRLPK